MEGSTERRVFMGKWLGVAYTIALGDHTQRRVPCVTASYSLSTAARCDAWPPCTRLSFRAISK